MASLRCSVCEKEFDSDKSPALPFCSRRCKLVDLNRWFGEEYGMPDVSEEEPDVPFFGEEPPEDEEAGK